MSVTSYRTTVRKTVELRGFEPLTFCMPCRRATSCAIAPQPSRRPVRSRPARWNAVSIQAPQPCVVLDRHDAATTPPRRRDTVATAQRCHRAAAATLSHDRRPGPTSINPPSAVTLLPDPHLATPVGQPRARTVGLTYHGTPLIGYG